MSRSSPAASSQSDDGKPYYQCKHNLRCKKCNGYWPDKCRCKQTIPSRDHRRFQTWFTDWRGVFANETQALAIFNAAQPENTKFRDAGGQSPAPTKDDQPHSL